MIQNESRFDDLIQAALAQDFSGWDFSYLQGRWDEEAIPWSYETIVKKHMQGIDSLLDMGTGGGEFLASLAPLPENTHATEAWQPNVPIARKRLEPMGITVHAIEEYAPLPFPDAHFDRVINRHEWYDPSEVYRILKPGGLFITQQVGDKNDLRLNELISGQAPEYDTAWNLSIAQKQFAETDFRITQAEDSFTPLHFFDIGAIVYYLKVVEWQIPDFSVEKYRSQLGIIHNMIERDGKLTVEQHRFILIAQKPE